MNTKKRPQYIDIHSHVNFAEYNTDREAVIKRAQDAEVWMINVGIDLKTSKEVVALAEKYEGVYAIVGLHPVHSHEGETFDVVEFEKLVQHSKVVGIGECGLDYFHL